MRADLDRLLAALDGMPADDQLVLAEVRNALDELGCARLLERAVAARYPDHQPRQDSDCVVCSALFALALVRGEVPARSRVRVVPSRARRHG